MNIGGHGKKEEKEKSEKEKPKKRTGFFGL
jgi:hypothetical protein